MWEEQRSVRFQELRQRQDESGLTEAEQAELAQLVKELEDAEAAYLTPATERLRREREAVETRNRVLQVQIAHEEALVLRPRDSLE